jgi:hypothetical protein
MAWLDEPSLWEELMWVGPVVWVSLNGIVNDLEVESLGWELVSIFVLEEDLRKPSSHS